MAILGRRQPYRPHIINAVKPGAIFVQANGAGFGQSSSARSVAFSSNVTLGDLIVVFADWFNTGTVTITDTIGNNYIQVGPTRVAADGTHGAFFYAISKASGADTVTLTPTDNVYTGLAIAEYMAPSGFSVDGYSTNIGHLATTFDTGSIPVSYGNDLVVGAFGQAATIVYTAGAGWNLRVNVPTGTTQMSVFLQDQQPVGAAIDALGTSTVPTDFVGIGVSFALKQPNPPIGLLTIKSLVVSLSRRRPVFHLQIINNIRPGTYPPPPIIPPIGTVVSKTLVTRLDMVAGRPVTHFQIRNQFANLYQPAQNPVAKRLLLSFAALQRNQRPIYRPSITNIFTRPPKRKPVPFFPFLAPLLSNDQRTRKGGQLISILLNSLFGKGQIVQLGPAEFSIVSPNGGVISFDGRTGAVTLNILDIFNAGGITTFNGRAGAVTLQAGDQFLTIGETVNGTTGDSLLATVGAQLVQFGQVVGTAVKIGVLNVTGGVTMSGLGGTAQTAGTIVIDIFGGIHNTNAYSNGQITIASGFNTASPDLRRGLYDGSGPPAGGLGFVGDYYLDEVAGVLYKKS